MCKSKKAYQYLWNSPHAEKIDLGASGVLDELYLAFLENDFFKQRPFLELQVVDLGAGRGSRLAQHLAERGASLTAVDWIYEDPAFVTRYPGTLIAADVLQSGLADGVADVVVSANVLINNSFFSVEGVKERYIQEIVRILKPGGVFWGEDQLLTESLFRNLPKIIDYRCFFSYYVHVFRKKD